MNYSRDQVQFKKISPSPIAVICGRSATVQMQLKADVGVVSWDLLGFDERLRLGLNAEE